MLLVGKKRGQILLLTLVVSTLVVLILMSVADRLLLTNFNIQRGAEFEASVAEAENRANTILTIFGSRRSSSASNCLRRIDEFSIGSNTGYVDLSAMGDCGFLSNYIGDIGRVKVRARRINNGSLQVPNNNSLVLKLSDLPSMGLPTTRILVKCTGGRALITRVFYQNNVLYSDKGITDCNRSWNYVSLIDDLGNTVSVQRDKTFYISARLLNGASAELGIVVEDSSGSVVATTDKYVFLIEAVGGLDGSIGTGSDALLKLDVGAGRTYISSSFLDYVYINR